MNRYYRRRATWARAVKPESCDAPYVRAGDLEVQVGNTITRILEQPDIVLEEIKRPKGEASVLEEELARLRGQLRRFGDQQRGLVHLYSFDEIDDSYVK